MGHFTSYHGCSDTSVSLRNWVTATRCELRQTTAAMNKEISNSVNHLLKLTGGLSLMLADGLWVEYLYEQKKSAP